jgi:hypothetical protein
MPYLDNRGPIKAITSFGKPTEGNSDVKFQEWTQKAPFAKPKLQFGQTHKDLISSQVREKTGISLNSKMSNSVKQKNAVPLKQGITTFGRFSTNDGSFPNSGGTFKVQSSQIQNRRGSTIEQQKKDGKI